MSRIEVLSGPERRRRWSAEQKRSIVAEAFSPGASVCEVARRRDVVAGQIYRWRHELRAAAAGFAEVVVAPEPSGGLTFNPFVTMPPYGSQRESAYAYKEPQPLVLAGAL